MLCLMASLLDKILAIADWADCFPDLVWEALSYLTSDHFPILLEANPATWGPTPLGLKICGSPILFERQLILDGVNAWWRVGLILNACIS